MHRAIRLQCEQGFQTHTSWPTSYPARKLAVQSFGGLKVSYPISIWCGELVAVSLVMFYSLYLNHSRDKETLAHTASHPSQAPRSGHFTCPLDTTEPFHGFQSQLVLITPWPPPAVPLLQLRVNEGFFAAPAPPLHGGRELLTFISPDYAGMNFPWQLAEISLAACLPLACMLCHQKALLSLFFFLHILTTLC